MRASPPELSTRRTTHFSADFQAFSHTRRGPLAEAAGCAGQAHRDD
ncbi:MAG: hypothetical protein AVDCRST_MAG68-3084 [uncultured Gemmatimonadetes bacterium]|uniref:Uncharacterized protein n=1 Tax=uncultured Gemmatimonadota bacterium TaxID=203437 RepID=A0A6J4LVZ4_9BACT|nr:MAG: hypothetical protein AVDCRST_MAG68-3084 [uncultured Gemmatimonadota bacterium]